jgi:hypothetical protein
MMKLALFAISCTIVVAARCSTCASDIVQPALSSPDGASSAIVVTRRCGSAEGWVVKITSRDFGEREVFLAEMPDPVSVVAVPQAVRVQWATASHLVIEAPKWILAHRADKSHGNISITYSPNSVPYPEEK